MKLEEFKYINVYILSKEDIVVSKIIRLADKDNYRLEMSKPLELIVNINKYREEEKNRASYLKKYVT